MCKTKTLKHILLQASKYGERTAIYTEATGARTSYTELCIRAHRLSQLLLMRHGQNCRNRNKNSNNGDSNNTTPIDLNGERVAFLVDRSASYVIAQWAIWAAGGIAVPLHAAHPIPEIQFVLQDCAASQIVTDSKHLATVELAKQGTDTPNLTTTTTTIQLLEEADLEAHSIQDDSAERDRELFQSNNFLPEKRAQILYTSGTTGKPKGVVTTHGNILAQIQDLIQAWEISENDTILHFLPLHHVHGILNKLLVPLYAGGCVYMLPLADPKRIWENLAKSTIFMAVPTIYHKLVDHYQTKMSLEQQHAARLAAQNLRVCISGSMSCPVPLIEKWEAITGHRLLERYGMTELGMVLSHPLHGIRHPGYVGLALPSVSVKLRGDCGDDDGTEGELLVKGDTVFESYWNRSEATREAFDERGWFQTGDLVEYCAEKDSYRILGRMSVDILKSGGHKLSAVEIEAALLTSDIVAECFVVGEPDDEWGQIVTAVIRLMPQVLTRGETIQHSYALAKEHLKEHALSKLAPYKVPRRFVFLDSIPKNAMGKVNKKQLLDFIATRFQHDALALSNQSDLSSSSKRGFWVLMASGIWATILAISMMSQH